MALLKGTASALSLQHTWHRYHGLVEENKGVVWSSQCPNLPSQEMPGMGVEGWVGF